MKEKNNPGNHSENKSNSLFLSSLYEELLKHS